MLHFVLEATYYKLITLLNFASRHMIKMRQTCAFCGDDINN